MTIAQTPRTPPTLLLTMTMTTPRQLLSLPQPQLPLPQLLLQFPQLLLPLPQLLLPLPQAQLPPHQQLQRRSRPTKEGLAPSM